MQTKLNSKITRRVAFIALIVASCSMLFMQRGYAAQITSMSDTPTRVRINQTADHTIEFTLPSGIDWDSTGNNDDLIIDFPHASSDFAIGGTWATGDFTADDGSSVSVTAVNEAAGSLTYPACGTGTVVAIDTTNIRFGFRRCTGNSSTAATITFTIDGTTSDGTLTNGTSSGSKTISISHTDEGSADANTGLFAVPLVDDDSLSVSATITPTMTFDIDTSTSHTEIAAPYTIDLTTLSPSTVKSSDNSATNSIYLDLSTNASGGATVTMKGENGGLNSTAVSNTLATTYADAAAVDLDGQSEGFGVCLDSATTSTSSGTITAVQPYNGSCDASSNHNVGGVDTSFQEVFNTGGNPVSGGDIELRVKAKASVITPAANDYTETLTFIATSTF